MNGKCSCGKDCGKSAGKHPRTEHGLQDGTTDPATIRRWWSRWPSANIGVCTGPESGIWMLGPDGEQGIAELSEMARRYSGLPRTPSARSGSGGRHSYFRWPDDGNIKNRKNHRGVPIDVRGEGGYFVAAPSANGVGPYRWEIPPDKCELAEAPKWLLAWVRADGKEKAASPSKQTVSGSSIVDRAAKYLEKMPPAISGQGGHDRTMEAARVVVYGFDLGPEVGYQILRDHFNPRCQPEWSEKELRHKCSEANTVPFDKVRGWLLADTSTRASTPRTRAQLSTNGHHSANWDAHSSSNGEAQTAKPEIILGTDEYRVRAEAINALSDWNAAPEIYQRGNILVRVLRARKAGKKDRFDRPDGTPSISALPAPCLSDILTRVANFSKWHTDRKGEQKLVPAHPPARCVSTVLAWGDWPKIRPLESIIEAPTLRPDGTILDKPGWDEATGLLYEPNADFPPIRETPSRGDALPAADRLLELVAEFPFAGTNDDEQLAHRAGWLAGLLTALVRSAISGPCPLFLFDANCPGTGKSLLTDTISITATGRDMSRTAFPDKEDELRKRITSIALAGDRLMLFDNLEQGQPFGGAALDSALTGTTWQDRLLGKNEMTPKLPLYTVFFATGNNVMLKGDAQRRVIPCRLESKEEKPEERGDFKYPDLLEHVRAHRPQLVADGLTILRAFVVAGSPQAKLAPFGSYEAWSRLIRQAIFWTMGVDPLQTRKEIRSTDNTLNTLAALLEGWAELPGAKTGISVAEALRILNDPNHTDGFATLRGALMEWSSSDRLPGPGTIGHNLRSLRKRVLDGQMLDAVPGHRKVQKWRVMKPG
jgi:hypothetical protein